MAAGSNTGDVNSDGTNITVPETGGGGNAGEAHSKQWDDIEETNEKEKPFNDFN
ncbi:hypothetical protein [Prevotella sp. OH937_COT-195]|uniref:hypothetical protein n=1 Tax=Prevotella sp. OH937_COT-195 TaxID=2491051 RepID=UPI0013152530|nr:hypothetical protein [Prevotella sp. OH937_COT-195]